MLELHKRILRENRGHIVNNIEDIPSIIDELLTKDVLTEGMKQDILEGENTAIKRARKLLDILPKRGPFAFDIFCNVLILKKHQDLAEALNPALKGAKTTPLSPSAPGVPTYTPRYPVPTAVSIPKPVPHIPKKKHETSPVQPTATPPQSSFVTKPGSLPGASIGAGASGKGDLKSPDEKSLGRKSSREIEKTFSPSDDQALADMIPIDWPSGVDFTLSSKDFEVKQMEEADLKVQLSLNVYGVTQVKRGRAVVINNKYFEKEDLAERNENDSFRLQLVLKGLGFRCIVKNNLTKDELFQELKKEKENDHLDMFVVVIMSYGGAGTVLSKDMQEIPIKDILDIFSTKNCSSLIGKPKLFFIQACGTKLKDYPVEPRSPDRPDKPTSPERADQATVDTINKISECMELLNLGQPESDFVDTKRTSTSDPLPLEETRDMLVAMATTPDQNNDKYSSLFILGLSYVLSNFAKTDHILDLLKRVNTLKRDANTGQYIELCQVRSSLTRFLYFFPGYVPPVAGIGEGDFQSLASLPLKAKP